LVIRCERCSTSYELDEALLSPDGSPVQCTRCQHVFTARPAVAAAPAAPAETPPAASPSTSVAAAPAEVAEPVAACGPRRPISDAPRSARSGPAVYRPAPAPTPGARGAVLRRDAVGTIDSRLRFRPKVRWTIPAGIAAVVLAIAAVAYLFLARRDPQADRLRAEGLALLAQGDVASVDAAIKRLDEAVRRAPRARSIAADRALAQVLRAAALAEESETFSTRAAERGVERDRLRHEASVGGDVATRLSTAADRADAEAAAATAAARDRAEQARVLREEAFAALRALEGASGPEVPRALATYHALGGDAALVAASVAEALAEANDDPWAALAELEVEARGSDRAGRERAAAALAALGTRHPELVRARFLLARLHAALGRRAEALGALDGVLAASPHHDGARALRAELTRPLPPAAPAQAAAAAQPENSGALPRKPVAQPVVLAPASAAPPPAVRLPPPALPLATVPAPDGLYVNGDPAAAPHAAPATAPAGPPRGALVPAAAPTSAAKVAPASPAHEPPGPDLGGG
jgi:predicted Zn finger-like uncharacterized protein